MDCVEELLNFTMTAISVLDVEHWLMRLIAYGIVRGSGDLGQLIDIVRIHLDKEGRLIEKARTCMEMEGIGLRVDGLGLEPLDSLTPIDVLRGIIAHSGAVDRVLNDIKAHLDRRLMNIGSP